MDLKRFPTAFGAVAGCVGRFLTGARKMTWLLWLATLSSAATVASSTGAADRLCDHEVVLDQDGRLLPWTSFDNVIKWSMNYIKRCPTTPTKFGDDPWYLVTSKLRFNSLRCVLQYLVWEYDPDGLKQRMDQFLGICQQRGIHVIFCLFDDCVFGPKHDPYLGKQADVVPGWYAHDWSPSPGWSRVKNPEAWPGPTRAPRTERRLRKGLCRVGAGL